MGILKVDICIIGAGSGGLSVAAGAAQLGAKVALIEAGKMGGDCLNYGCIPSKSLLATAKRANVFRSSEAFGIDKTDPKIDFKKVYHHIHDVITNLSPQDSVERFEKLGVQVIQEKAHFLSPTLLQAGNLQIQSKYFVIATGSSPAIPPLPGINNVPYFTNETIFNLKDKPKHLLIVGGGPIGCELAQAYQLLGVKTTILEAFTLLPKEDNDVVSLLRHRLKTDGVEILEGAKVLSLSLSNWNRC
jgi:pyruvate/2-oxoglutarate dehydrogenase complex dihydrolipoamide dehydrogenase (E3) component